MEQVQQGPSNQLSQSVEREVRTLIGDLHMRIIVLQQMLDMAQQQPTTPRPKENPQPLPTEPRPEPKPVPQPPAPQPHMHPVINGADRS